MKIIDKLPEELRYKIFEYTEEFYRLYCKKRRFRRLASVSNDIFPRSIFKRDISYRQVLFDWKLKKRDKFINDEIDQYKKYGIRPSLQHCIDKNNNYER